MFKHALIMAAGEGSRMRPLTTYVPKAMVEIGGQKLIKYSIDLLQSNNKNIDIHVTVGYKQELLSPYLLENSFIKSVINTKHQHNGWWIFNSLIKYINEPIVVLTCDNIMGLNLKKVYNNYVELGSPACMIVPVIKENNQSEGDFIYTNEDNAICYIGRDKTSMLMASGCQIINPYKLNQLINPEDNFVYIWEDLIKIKELKCSNITPNVWESFDNINQIVDQK